MENKIGFGAGILLVVLCFLAEIPLGVYFVGGATQSTGIPLNLLEAGGRRVFLWGAVDVSVQPVVAATWLETGTLGVVALVLYTLLPLAAGVLALAGAWTKAQAGRTVYMVSIILVLVTLVFLVLDAYLLTLLAFTTPVTGFPVGPGFVGICVGLGLTVVAWRLHPKEDVSMI